jgi:pimeloyl-ACP methyl ester carboxylesterase
MPKTKTSNNDEDTKPLINFVHANGFPAGSYKTFLRYFKPNYTIIAHEKYGHDQRFPIQKNWQYLVDELIYFLSKQKEPVICIGHSFGGVISFMAACKRPDLIKGVIMLDPPAMTGILGIAFKLAQKTKYIDKITPAGRSKNRRSQWPIHTDLAKLFSTRKLFKNFDQRCLQDYSESAVKQKNNALELNFTAQAETAIYRNIPTHLSSFKNKLKVPAVLIYGENTDLFPHYFFKRFAKKNKKIDLQSIKGGHMFPLEYPMETAEMIKGIIKAW